MAKSYGMGALLISAGLMAVGMLIFLKDYAYVEATTGPIMLGFVVANIVFFLTFRQSKYAVAIPAAIIMALCLGAMVAKYEWRKDYMLSGFVLEKYLSSYPSLEQYMMMKITGEGENWVDYANDCVKPILAQRQGGPNCGSEAAIRQAYGINVNSAMKKELRRMSRTAQSIVDQDKRLRYPACIGKKRCSEVPLLPPGVDGTTIGSMALDHKDVRVAFWDLVEKEDITPEICRHMDLCIILTRSGVLKPEDFS